MYVLVPFQGILVYWLIGAFYIAKGVSGLGSLLPPPESGCFLKNYGCYCPQSSGQRKIPSKCSNLFDEELMNSANKFPGPVTLKYPNLGANFNAIDMKAANICRKDKYCEIRIAPKDPDWSIIDWCITSKANELHHLQLLGPPHSPVCCDPQEDQKYTMMCMRRDFSLQRYMPSTLLISVYIKLLPRAPVNFQLSLVLLNKASVSNGAIPVEFKNKKNSGGATVMLVKIEDLILDLSKVKRWSQLIV